MESRPTAPSVSRRALVQRVWDDRGAVCELGEKLAEGGFGTWSRPVPMLDCS